MMPTGAMPRHLYDDFTLARIELKPFKPGSGQTGERYYAIFECPHCNAEIDVVNSLIGSKKGAACSAHLKKCEACQAKQSTAQSSSRSIEENNTVAGLRKLMEESEARHKKLMEESEASHQQRHKQLLASADSVGPTATRPELPFRPARARFPCPPGPAEEPVSSDGAEVGGAAF